MRRAGRGSSGFAAVGDDDVGGFGGRDGRVQRLDDGDGEHPADDHKAYYPGSHRITLRVTGDRTTGRLLGLQLFGHKNAEIAKRTDIAATAIFHGMTVDAVSDLDLSSTPPLGSPWDAVQMAAQAWVRQTRPR